MKKMMPVVVGILFIIGAASNVFASSADGLNLRRPDKTVQIMAPSEVQDVAVFQDQDPWDSTALTDALTAQGITYTVYGSAQMGAVSLSPFDKVIIASQQPPSFYAALSTNRAWFETYINQGGIFEFHGASYFDDDWSALPMPAGLAIAPQGDTNADNELTIADAQSPLVDGLNNNSIDDWGWSTHSYFTGAGFAYNTVIVEDEFDQPVLIEGPMGNGHVIATMMTVEYRGGTLVANLVGFSGASAPTGTIPTLNEWGLIALSVLLICLAAVRIRQGKDLAAG